MRTLGSHRLDRYWPTPPPVPIATFVQFDPCPCVAGDVGGVWMRAGDGGVHRYGLVDYPADMP